jgi:hypothetical protein
VVLVRVGDDADPCATPGFDALVRQVFSKQNDHDWVLDVKLGDVAILIVLAGRVGKVVLGRVDHLASGGF